MHKCNPSLPLPVPAPPSASASATATVCVCVCSYLIQHKVIWDCAALYATRFNICCVSASVPVPASVPVCDCVSVCECECVNIIVNINEHTLAHRRPRRRRRRCRRHCRQIAINYRVLDSDCAINMAWRGASESHKKRRITKQQGKKIRALLKFN